MNGTGKSPEDYEIEDFVTDESFINYFFQLNADDKLFWEDWLVNHPLTTETVQSAKAVLRDLSLTISEQEFQVELARMSKAIHYDTPLFIKKRPVIGRLPHWGKSSRFLKNKTRKYAYFLVALLLIIMVGGYYYLRHFTAESGQLSEKYNDSSKPEVFTLPDGTVVTLAPQSIFRYPEHFGNKDRNVYLNGEAQFHVNRDEAHPFKVYEGDIVATVLGTIFNVKKQPGDSLLLVELIKGKLKVETNKQSLPVQSVILNPDERVVYNRHNQTLYKERWQAQPELVLEVNHIVFLRNNFNEIAKKIKTVFDVTVINQSKKKNWLFSGEFENATAREIIENICLVEGLKSEASGDSIIIK
jgi:transmembrane sensor